MVYEYLSKVLREQNQQVSKLMRRIHSQNPIILPALINPKPLLSQNIPVDIVIGTSSQALEILVYTWKYFEILPGARKVLTEFLGGDIKYDAKIRVKKDGYKDTTGYDRAYCLKETPIGRSMLFPTENDKMMDASMSVSSEDNRFF